MLRGAWNRLLEILEDNAVELLAWSAVVLLFTIAYLCFRFVLDQGRH